MSPRTDGPSSISYRYRALRGDGSVEEGFLDHGERQDAVSALRARGLHPVSVDPAPVSPRGSRSLSADDLAVGFRTLAALVESGLSLSRAIAAFAEVAPDAWRRSVGSMQERVRQGDGLATALERSGAGVPPLFIGVIRAGEGGTGLGAAVRRAADLAETRAALRASIRSALAYPALLACVGAASIALIVGVVLPRFAVIIADVGGAVPPLARGIVAGARVVRSSAVPGLVLIIGCVVLWRVWANDPGVRTRIHLGALRLPAIGALRLAAASSRFCSTMAAMLDAGVTVAPAMSHAAGATGDLEMERRILEARARVIGGARLSAALAGEKAVTATAVRLIRAGEESGRLAEMLGRAAALDVNRLNESLKMAVGFIEPVMIIGFAGLIATVCGALLQTVYAVHP